jgi:hypothetical protein
MVKDADRLLVGVPEIMPELVFRTNPAGNAPALTAKLYGAEPPEPLRVCE